MLSENEIKRYINRINQYNEYTVEKEIETEFYNLLKTFYTRKYTDMGEGKISYTAPYNIDGLLEVRTLETDYRILVEAKASKNYKDKRVRDEVLSQAIYYINKLKSLDEQLPSIIMLIEAKSIVLINIEELEQFNNVDFKNIRASEAGKIDVKLVNTLNKTDYHYKLIDFDDTTDYNVIINYIDSESQSSKYSSFKVKNDYNICLNISDFINKYKIFKSEGSYYYFFVNYFTKTTIGNLKNLLLQEVNLRKIGVEKGFNILEELISDKMINHIRIGDDIINLETKKLENEVYTINFDDVKFKSVEGGYDYRTFSEYLIGAKYKDEYIIIHTRKENNRFFEKLLTKFNTTYEFNRGSSYIYRGLGVIIFNNIDELVYDFNINKNYRLLNLDDFNSYDELVNKMIISYKNFDYNEDKYLYNFILEWQENNDLVRKWAKQNLKIAPGSVILLQDAFESFNLTALQSGQAEYSLRNFTPTFTNHSYFFDNKIAYKTNTRINKKLTHSQWFDPRDKSKMPREANGPQSFFLNVAFKNNDENID